MSFTSLICLHLAPNLDTVATFGPNPESDIQEYFRNVERKYVRELFKNLYTYSILPDCCKLAIP